MGQKSKEDQSCLPAAGGSGPVRRVCLHSLCRLLLSAGRHKQFGLWRCAVCPCSNQSVPAHVFTLHVPDSLSARDAAANIALRAEHDVDERQSVKTAIQYDNGTTTLEHWYVH